MNKNDKILILGASGMVGKSLVNTLIKQGFNSIYVPTSKQLNLKLKSDVDEYLRSGFDYVFFVAAKVGGIMANIAYPATFGYDNALMELNVIHSCYENKVKKMLFMGSSCIYPRNCPQPMKEEYLLSGALESTNEMYSLAKIMGLKLCQSYNTQYKTNFISCMPSNLYGPDDNFDPESSHVMAAMIRKFHLAKLYDYPFTTCFGSGQACREFLYVADVADACIFLMDNYNDSQHINVGMGTDISIYDLAHLVAKIVGYTGEIQWDTSKPDGMPRKVVDTTKINNLGWKAQVSLEDGIAQTYKWFLEEEQ